MDTTGHNGQRPQRLPHQRMHLATPAALIICLWTSSLFGLLLTTAFTLTSPDQPTWTAGLTAPLITAAAAALLVVVCLPATLTANGGLKLRSHHINLAVALTRYRRRSPLWVQLSDSHNTAVRWTLQPQRPHHILLTLELADPTVFDALADQLPHTTADHLQQAATWPAGSQCLNIEDMQATTGTPEAWWLANCEQQLNQDLAVRQHTTPPETSETARQILDSHTPPRIHHRLATRFRPVSRTLSALAWTHTAFAAAAIVATWLPTTALQGALMLTTPAAVLWGRHHRRTRHRNQLAKQLPTAAPHATPDNPPNWAAT